MTHWNDCSASLAAVQIAEGAAGRFAAPLELALRFNYVRTRLEIDGRRLDLSLTDLRLYDPSFAPDTVRVAALARRLNQGRPTILAIGLTRLWKKSADDVEYHWLQVNNIFVHDDPYLSDAGHE